MRRMSDWRNDKISKVGRRGSDDGTIRCPGCGGTQFKARRSNFKRTAVVALLPVAAIAAPLTKKNQVQCVTCGAKFKRG